MKNNKYLYYTFLSALFTLSGLVIAIFLKSGQFFKFDILVNHLIITMLVVIYMLILSYFNLSIALRIFFYTTIAATIYIILAMPKNPVGFADLGALIGWIFIMLIGLFVGLLFQIIVLFNRK